MVQLGLKSFPREAVHFGNLDPKLESLIDSDSPIRTHMFQERFGAEELALFVHSEMNKKSWSQGKPVSYSEQKLEIADTKFIPVQPNEPIYPNREYITANRMIVVIPITHENPLSINVPTYVAEINRLLQIHEIEKSLQGKPQFIEKTNNLIRSYGPELTCAFLAFCNLDRYLNVIVSKLNLSNSVLNQLTWLPHMHKNHSGILIDKEPLERFYKNVSGNRYSLSDEIKASLLATTTMEARGGDISIVLMSDLEEWFREIVRENLILLDGIPYMVERGQGDFNSVATTEQQRQFLKDYRDRLKKYKEFVTMYPSIPLKFASFR